MYASKTKVPINRSQQEIQKILTKYKANSFAYGEQGNVAVVMFEMEGRRIRFNLPMPSPTVRGYEQKSRARWRCLVLAIKAKLECVESGKGLQNLDIG